MSSGEADRRAVGRRRGRLPGRQLPAAVVGVERPLPRHDPRLLAGRAGHARRVRLALHRAAPTCTRPTAAARRRRSTSSPPTTASRSPTSSRTTRSTTRPTARSNRDGESHNRSWNCGAEGRRTDDDPAIIALRARQRRNFVDHAAAVAGRADAPRRRRARPHPARQQQRLLPGQRASRGSTGSDADDRRSSSGAGQVIALATQQPRLPSPSLVPGPPDPGHRGARLAASGRAGDVATTTGTTATPESLGVLLNGSAISTPGRVRRPRRRRLVPAPVQRQRARPAVDAARRLAVGRSEPWTVELDTALGLVPGTEMCGADRLAARRCRSAGRSGTPVVVLRSATMTRRRPAPTERRELGVETFYWDVDGQHHEVQHRVDAPAWSRSSRPTTPPIRTVASAP